MWHYLTNKGDSENLPSSPGLGEASSADICWDGDAFVPSKSKTTLGGYCLPDNRTGACHSSPFGMILRRSTEPNGGDELMWYQGDSPVRTYLAPEKVKDSAESEADSGPRWQGSLARYNPATYSWRTAQCLLLGGLKLFSETWPRWGMMRDGELFPLKTPALYTRESESGLWPTPNTAPERPNEGNVRMLRAKVLAGEMSEDEAKSMLHGKSPMGAQGKIEVWPTPRASAIAAAATMLTVSHIANPRGNLEEVVWERTDKPDSGHLNPTWAEWLMGWPLGWTDLEPLATGKCPLASGSHGKS